MSRMTGTVSRGVRAPIIRQGDDLPQIVTDCVLEAAKTEGFQIHDRDVIGVTEAVVARAQGNYASIDDIAADIREKFADNTVGLLFPILSRNRFAICLKGIARGAKKIVLMLSYPSDEVGNSLISQEKLEDTDLNPWSDVLSEARYRSLFGENKHVFTGVDYVEYYGSIIRGEGCEAEIIFANKPAAILDYTPYVLTCDIHTREHTKRVLRQAGAKAVYGLDDILCTPTSAHGYNADYGLLGTNKATENTVKLFPRACADFASRVQTLMREASGKTVEVLVYGDGAFRDPVGKIWELADPVVSPGFTDGLNGLPNEVKLKYLADNQFSELKGDALRQAMTEYIRNKKPELKGSMETQGTTPRRLTDLIGSLCDLTSGSGDKGTPIILIQGYFDTYAD